jgi:hypothetical protein
VCGDCDLVVLLGMFKKEYYHFRNTPLTISVFNLKPKVNKAIYISMSSLVRHPQKTKGYT